MGEGSAHSRAHRAGRPGQIVAGVVVVALAVAAVIAVFYLAAPRELTGEASPSESPTPPLLGGVPAEGQEDPAPEPSLGAGRAVPFITSALLDPVAGHVAVRAFVPGLAEDGGVCRAILSGSAESAAVEVPARIEVATTTCEVMIVATTSTIPEGLSVVVEYESPTSSGRSEAAGVETR
jgi:hypothetical protein